MHIMFFIYARMLANSKRSFLMYDAKRGLRLLSFSIILNIAWSIAVSFLFENGSENFKTYIPVITLGILLVCYLVDFAGLHLAGHDNDHFRSAWKLKIITLVLTLAAIVFALIVAIKKDPDMQKTLSTFTMIVHIFALVAEVLVLIFVIKGCREISPRVQGLSKFVGGLFVLQTLLIIALEVLSYVIIKNDIPTGDVENPIIIASLALAITFSVFALLFLVLYILLIFRTTTNVGKTRRH